MLTDLCVFSEFWPESEQKVQTPIRLLLKEQSDLGLHCLPFCLHPLEAFLYITATLFRFYRLIRTKVWLYV